MSLVPELGKEGEIIQHFKQGGEQLRRMAETLVQPSGDAAPLCAGKDDPPEAVTLARSISVPS